MNLNFELTESDILAFQHQLSNKKLILFKPIPLITAIGIPAYVLISSNGNLNELYDWLPLIAGLIVFYYMLSSFRLKKGTENFVKNNPGLVGDREIQLSDDELTYISAEAQTTYDLGKFQNIIEQRNHIFLFIGKDTAVIVPKRAFSEESQKNEFLIKVNTPTNTRQPSP